MKYKKQISLMLGGLLCLCFAQVAFANAFTGSAGFDEGNYVIDSSGVNVSVGNKVEFVYFGPNKFINDPQTTVTNNWRGEPVYAGGDDICVNYNTDPTTGFTNAVGDDREVNMTYQDVPGRFNHLFLAPNDPPFEAVTGSSQNYVYVRVWAGDPDAAGTLFGESVLFTPTTQGDAVGGVMPPLGTPNQKYFSEIKCVLKREKPANVTGLVATGLGAKTDANLGDIPKISLSFNRSIGARWYKIEYQKQDDGSWSSWTDLTNTAHKADVETGSASSTINLPIDGDDAVYSVRVGARNDFPSDEWTVLDEISVPRTPDTVVPTAINDLRVSLYEDDLVTLAWSAPSDTDRYGNSGQRVASYDIRSAGQPIVDDAELAISDLYTMWDNATQLENFLSPLAPGGEENFPTTGITETTYFAIKSSDGAEYSPISNITGVAVGSNQLESTIELVNGLNFFSLGVPPTDPFNPVWYISQKFNNGEESDPVEVSTVDQFKEHILTNNDFGLVSASTFGYVNLDGDIVGYIKEAGGVWDVPVDEFGAAINFGNLSETQGYQIYLNLGSPVDLKVRNYPGAGQALTR